jgi:hypothetical protein
MARVESTFRVYRFSPQFVESFRKARDRQELITCDFVSAATDAHLSVVVKELRAVGLLAPSAERRAVRFEMRLDTLAGLSDASQQVGRPEVSNLPSLPSSSLPERPKEKNGGSLEF